MQRLHALGVLLVLFSPVCGMRRQVFWVSQHTTSWNQAYTTCLHDNLQMADVTSAVTQNALERLLETIETDITQDIWIGLHNNGYSSGISPDFRWGDCTSLSSWNNWGSKQPGSDPNKMCTEMDERDGFRWKTASCSDGDNLMLCVEDGGECKFEIANTTKCRKMPKETYSSDNVSPTECEHRCTAEVKNGMECWLYEWKSGSTPRCELHFDTDPYFCAEELENDPASTVGIKHCFDLQRKIFPQKLGHANTTPVRDCNIPTTSLTTPIVYASTSAPLTTVNQHTTSQQTTKQVTSQQTNNQVTSQQTSTQVKSQQTTNQVTSQQTNNQVTSQQTSTQVTTQQTNNQVTSQQTNNQVTSQQTNNQVTSQQTSTQKTTQQTNNQVTSQQTNNQVTSQQTNNQVTSQQTSTQVTSQQTNNQVTSQQTNNQVTSQQTSTQVTTQQTNNQVTSQQTNNQVTSQQTNNQVTSQQTSTQVTSQQTNNQVTSQQTNNQVTLQQTTNKVTSQQTTNLVTSQQTMAMTNVQEPTTDTSMPYTNASSSSSSSSELFKRISTLETPYGTTSLPEIASNYMLPSEGAGSLLLSSSDLADSIVATTLMHDASSVERQTLSPQTKYSLPAPVLLTSEDTSAQPFFQLSSLQTADLPKSAPKFSSSVLDSIHIFVQTTSPFSQSVSTPASTVNAISVQPQLSDSPLITSQLQSAAILCHPCPQNSCNRQMTSKSELRGLQLDPHNLSSHRRKKTSAADERPSAVCIGVTGIILLSLTFVFIVAVDATRFLICKNTGHS